MRNRTIVALPVGVKWTIGVNVLDVHRLPHHALCRLTILTPVLCALINPANRLRPRQLTHRWVSAPQG